MLKITGQDSTACNILVGDTRAVATRSLQEIHPCEGFARIAFSRVLY